MNAKECLETRRSIRKYKADAIPVDVLYDIVETAKYAPSWKNTQIARYHVVTNPVLKEKIATDCVCDFKFNTKTLLQAPAIVIVSYVTKRCGYERDGSFTTSKGDRCRHVAENAVKQSPQVGGSSLKLFPVRAGQMHLQQTACRRVAG